MREHLVRMLAERWGRALDAARRSSQLQWRIRNLQRDSVRVLDVNKHLTHDPTCGAMQWFHPLAQVDGATMGVAAKHFFTGSALGTKWSDPNKRSAFFGTFSY